MILRESQRNILDNLHREFPATKEMDDHILLNEYAEFRNSDCESFAEWLVDFNLTSVPATPTLPDEVTDVENLTYTFEVSRSDLLELFEIDHFKALVKGEPSVQPTSLLLNLVLQEVLYDSDDGPQLAGQFTLKGNT